MLTVKTYNDESRATLAESRAVKSREEKRVGGLIENWSLIPMAGNENRLVIVGNVVSDSYWGNETIRTSLIVSINEDETEAETLNTIYKLGTKASA